MKNFFIIMLALSMLSVATRVSSENDMAMLAIDPNKSYSFTGHFKRIKGTRHNADTIVLAHNNTDRNIFINIFSSLTGNTLSQSMQECIGDPSHPYDGPVEIVSAITRRSSYWITLRLQDAVCKRL